MFNFKPLAPIGLVLGVALAATGAQAGSLLGGAGFTTINPIGGTNNNERCLVGTAASSGDTCTNTGTGGTFDGQRSIMSILAQEVGGVTRIQDFDNTSPNGSSSGPGPLTSVGGHVLDQLWSSGGNNVHVRATARYLGATVETLGYVAGTTPLTNNNTDIAANFHGVLPLLSPPNQLQTTVVLSGSGDETATGDIKPVTASFVTFSVAGQLFRFAIVTNLASGNANWTSFEGNSPNDGTGDAQTGDHMVAFQFDNDPLAFFIAFDDQQASNPADFDFNDTVFEVHFSVPEPASLTIFGMSLLGLGALVRRRKAVKA